MDDLADSLIIQGWFDEDLIPAVTTTATKAWANVAGTWRLCTIYTNVSGTWRLVTPYVNVGGTWK
jgi:hypothetical protein